MFFLIPLLSSIGSGIGSAGAAIGSGIGSAAGAIGSAAGSVGGALGSAGKGIVGPLLTKGGSQAVGPEAVGMTGGMSDLPAMTGSGGIMGLAKGLANTVSPGSDKLLSKGDFMGNFNEMIRDPRFINYMLNSKILPEQQPEEEKRRKYNG